MVRVVDFVGLEDGCGCGFDGRGLVGHEDVEDWWRLVVGEGLLGVRICGGVGCLGGMLWCGGSGCE